MTREEAINNNKNLRMYMRLSDKNQPYKFLEENYIALDMAIKALEQEPCEDAISRREAIKKFTYKHKGERIPDYDCDNFPVQIDLKTVKEILMKLPPVIPQPKIGKWIINGIGYSETYSYKLNCSCSVCGYKAVFYDHISSNEPCLENANYVHKFCPNCGFRMIEPQESEDKDG